MEYNLAEVQAEVAKVKNWRHTITLPNGIITPGTQTTIHGGFCFGIPKDLTGKRVLDIGCSDGFYSFECERRGASYVLAVDDFSSVYVDSSSAFHVAHNLLKSKVEFRQADFMQLDPKEIGQFDLVLFLGVLYHLRHPLLALEQLAKLCKEQLIIETLIAPPKSSFWDKSFNTMMSLVFKNRRRDYSAAFPGRYMEFYEEDDMNRDPTNWWAPSVDCLQAMLRSCGFCNIQTISSHGTLHAFNPHQGKDAAHLLATYDQESIRTEYKDILGHDPNEENLLLAIKNLSIVQFGELKQRLRLIISKQWHQTERFK